MDFLRQWKPLLNRVLAAIQSSGIRVEDQEQLALLREVEAAIRAE